ncbi:MAG: hypothetical protein AAF823_00325 [Planctomycetota bacterium]
MPLMSKHQMIEAIRQRNRSATVEYLTDFDEDELKTYLARLTDLIGHRGPDSVWTRNTRHSCFARRTRVAA